MSKKINATENLRQEGAEQLCQPKCLTGQNYVGVFVMTAHWLACVHLCKHKLI